MGYDKYGEPIPKVGDVCPGSETEPPSIYVSVGDVVPSSLEDIAKCDALVGDHVFAATFDDEDDMDSPMYLEIRAVVVTKRGRESHPLVTLLSVPAEYIESHREWT